MNQKILFSILLSTATACSNVSPVVGTWVPSEGTEEWVISQQDGKYNVTIMNQGVSQGIYPITATEKGFTLIQNAGLGTGQFNCSLTKKNSMDCNLIVSTIVGSNTRPFTMQKKK